VTPFPDSVIVHPLTVIFWILFASVAAFIGWSFLRMFAEMLDERRYTRGVKPSGRADNAGTGGAVSEGVQSYGDASAPMSQSEYGSSATSGDPGSGDSTGDSGGGDSGGGDFSGGGGESGGGGSSGSW
jgi:uncharacterized membrane protein YgcG